MLNPVFINSVVLCRDVETFPKESQLNLIGVFHSLLPDYTVPDWKIDLKCKILVTAVVEDASAIHKIDIGLKSPDGSERRLGDFTLAIPNYQLSVNLIPFEMTLNQEGLHYLFFFLGQTALQTYALPVGVDTVLVN